MNSENHNRLSRAKVSEYESFEFLPSLSLRGAERRSNLMFIEWLCHCFVGLRPPRNDKWGVFQRLWYPSKKLRPWILVGIANGDMLLLVSIHCPKIFPFVQHLTLIISIITISLTRWWVVTDLLKFFEKCADNRIKLTRYCDARIESILLDVNVIRITGSSWWLSPSWTRS